MKVKWSENAGKEFASLVAYVAHEFGNKVALKLRDEIFSCVKRISEFPQLGMSSFVDEMTNVEFRELKAGLNSVVYSIYNNEIYVVSIWCNRQDRSKLYSSLRQMAIEM